MIHLRHIRPSIPVFTLCLASLLVAVAGMLAAAPAGAADSAPAWRLTVTSQPTNFVSGETNDGSFPEYSIVATNIGGAPTTASPITIEDTLPPGITPTAVFAQHNNAASFSCSIDAQTLTCVDPEPLNSGEVELMQVNVDVTAADGSILTNDATVSGGGALTVNANTTTVVSSSLPAFGFLPGPNGLGASLTTSNGLPATDAGSHPYQLTIDLGLPSRRLGVSGPDAHITGADGGLRDLRTDLPQGLIVNPAATPVRCTEAQLESGSCPNESAVGTVTVLTVSVGTPQPSPSALYNMVPPPGSPAVLGSNIGGLGIFVHVRGGVRSDGDYGLTAVTNDILARSPNPVLAIQAQLWGDPSDPSHDHVRGDLCINGGGTCLVAARTIPFLSMPSACSDSVVFGVGADSWGHPGDFVSANAPATDASGDSTGVDDCFLLDFEPKLTLRPDASAAESPTGVNVDLHIPQHVGLDELATSNLKDATVTLPAGMAVNPASAGGLDACSPTQIGLTTPVGQSDPIHLTNAPDNCPAAAKIGSVEVTTPLLDHPLPGSVYVATPHQNPFGSLLAVYISINDPADGIFVKLAGHVEANPSTGQLTTTFTENPELPVEDFKLDFFGGPRAALRTPSACGSYATTGEFGPWSGNPAAHATDSFPISSGANGGACTSTESQRPNAPSFEAGTLTPIAASYSPFVLHLKREDGQQLLKGLDLTLPPGLTGKLAGVPECSDAQIAQARSREHEGGGREELANPSCPSASQVGEVTVGVGAGPNPYYTKGKVYLAGPYDGAPLSFAVITPAVAGPYDLGNVVVRAAAHVDPITAVITVNSDPLPTILDGIPLQVRDVRVNMGRPHFILNPTSCDPMSILGAATSALGQVAPFSSRFQVAGCSALQFKPTLAIRLKGGTKRGGHPKLIATLTAKPGEANIARTSVKLPRSEFLDQGHIRTVCTRVQFNVGGGGGEQCPAGSIYGVASATSPLLDNPLTGNAYLRSSSNPLPDLVMALKGPASQPIEVDLSGRTDSVKGALRNTFDVVPDAPVSKFRLELFGGKRGLVVNSRNICAQRYRAAVKMDGQNGKTYDTTPLVQNSCKRKGKKHRAHQRHRRPAG